MEGDPFLITPLLQTHLSSPLPYSEIDEDTLLNRHVSSSSFSKPLFGGDIECPPPRPQPAAIKKRSAQLQRARTAPAMAAMRDLIDSETRSSYESNTNAKKPNFGSSASILTVATVLFLIYLCLGVIVYSTVPTGFSGIETHPAVDAVYFCIVTLSTIGYGDITPLTPATKVFACLFVLVGFGIVDVLLSAALNYILDVQESMILETARAGAGGVNYIFDAEKGRMRIRLKVGIAIGVVVLCIGAGAVVLHHVEGLDWIDSIYLSVMSVTTVGYGDRAFTSLSGRIFASFWLLVSTLAVARAFLYLAEARIDKRHRRLAEWVLHRDLTVEDLLAADLNHNGFISKSEFVIYKLKEMGRISEKDVLQICNQFNKLDLNKNGKITLPDLLNHNNRSS